jgi:transposase
MTLEQLRALAEQAMQLLSQIDSMGQKIHRLETVNEQLAHEIAILKRHKFAKRSEQLSPDQGSLLDDLLDTDIAAIEAELKAANPPAAPAEPRQQPKRAPLPPQFPRTVIHHEPENTQCACGCQLQRIGEDVSEKLDYTPGVFSVEQHVRGKWACRQCETLIQAPVPAQAIDKGIPTAGLLAHVMVAKFADHLPLYRQEKIFGRAGLMIARSTLAQWVGQAGVQLQPLVDALREAVLTQNVIHADETRCKCSHQARRKLIGLTSGSTAPRRFRHSRPWFTTSVQAGRANMHAASLGRGTASWCATTLLATKPVLSKALPKLVV